MTQKKKYIGLPKTPDYVQSSATVGSTMMEIAKES